MEKDLAYYMRLPYKEITMTASDGGFVGYIPELKGCITQGETEEEIVEMLADAKKCWLEAALEDGIDIPEPVKNECLIGGLNLRFSEENIHSNTTAYTAANAN